MQQNVEFKILRKH